MHSMDQEIIKKLLEENEEFKALYERHRELNKEVDKAGVGELPMSDDTLHNLKKEKLFLKDKMEEFVKNYKGEND